jgi:DNA-directed RNA polymerase I, II, and III subunit RPABC1
MDQDEIYKLYTIWNSLMKMLQDREYQVPDELMSKSQYNFKLALQEAQKRDVLNTEFVKSGNASEKILLFFDDSPRVTVPVISSLAQKMNAEGIQRAILIGKSGITNSALQAIQEIITHFVIEFFDEKELVSNYQESDSAQHHVILSEEEKVNFLERFQIKETQIPKIDLNDPVAKHYGLLKGEIIKMVKITETSGKFFTYRVGY